MLLRAVLRHGRPLLAGTHWQRLDKLEGLGIRSQARWIASLLARGRIADAQALCEVERRFAFAEGEQKLPRCAF